MRKAGRIAKFDGSVAFNPTELVESDRKFAGWLTVAVRDRQGDIVIPEGITADEYVKVMGGPLLDMHSNKPIGRITQMALKPKNINGKDITGVYVEGFIFKGDPKRGLKEYPAWTSAWDEITQSFRGGKPLGLSLGGDPDGVHMRREGNEWVRVIPITYLEEVSLVRRSSRPANPESMLEEYNSLAKSDDDVRTPLQMSRIGVLGTAWNHMLKKNAFGEDNEEGTDAALSINANNKDIAVGVFKSEDDGEDDVELTGPMQVTRAALVASMRDLVKSTQPEGAPAPTPQPDVVDHSAALKEHEAKLTELKPYQSPNHQPLPNPHTPGSEQWSKHNDEMEKHRDAHWEKHHEYKQTLASYEKLKAQHGKPAPTVTEYRPNAEPEVKPTTPMPPSTPEEKGRQGVMARASSAITERNAQRTQAAERDTAPKSVGGVDPDVVHSILNNTLEAFKSNPDQYFKHTDPKTGHERNYLPDHHIQFAHAMAQKVGGWDKLVAGDYSQAGARGTPEGDVARAFARAFTLTARGGRSGEMTAKNPRRNTHGGLTGSSIAAARGYNGNPKQNFVPQNASEIVPDMVSPESLKGARGGETRIAQKHPDLEASDDPLPQHYTHLLTEIQGKGADHTLTHETGGKHFARAVREGIIHAAETAKRHQTKSDVESVYPDKGKGDQKPVFNDQTKEQLKNQKKRTKARMLWVNDPSRETFNPKNPNEPIQGGKRLKQYSRGDLKRYKDAIKRLRGQEVGHVGPIPSREQQEQEIAEGKRETFVQPRDPNNRQARRAADPVVQARAAEQGFAPPTAPQPDPVPAEKEFTPPLLWEPHIEAPAVTDRGHASAYGGSDPGAIRESKRVLNEANTATTHGLAYAPSGSFSPEMDLDAFDRAMSHRGKQASFPSLHKADDPLHEARSSLLSSIQKLYEDKNVAEMFGFQAPAKRPRGPRKGPQRGAKEQLDQKETEQVHRKAARFAGQADRTKLSRGK